MHMSIWLGYDLQDFMFYGLTISSILPFVFTNILFFLLAVVFEASKILLAHSKKSAAKAYLVLNKREEQRRHLRQAAQTNSAEPGPSGIQSGLPFIPKRTLGKRCSVQMLLTLLHMMHNTLGYFLMLAVMVYNAYLIISVVLGLVAGYFIFAPKLIEYQMRCVKTGPVCTPECDENAAEGTNTSLLEAPEASSRTQLFNCETATCSGYSTPPVPCRFGAEHCPAKVARLTPEGGAGDEDAMACCQERVTVQVEQVKENLLQFDTVPVCCKGNASNDNEKTGLIEKNGERENGACCKSKMSTLEEAKEKLLNLNINIGKGGEAGSETEVLIEKEAKDSGKESSFSDSEEKDIKDNDVSMDKPGCCPKKNVDNEKDEWKEEGSDGKR